MSHILTSVYCAHCEQYTRYGHHDCTFKNVPKPRFFHYNDLRFELSILETDHNVMMFIVLLYATINVNHWDHSYIIPCLQCIIAVLRVYCR